MGATRTDERGTAARTLGAIVLEAADRYDSTALKYKSGEDWKDVSFGELGKSVRGIARGLIAMGIEPGDRVAVIGETRPEWTYADFGALCAGAVVVPVYHTASAEEIQHVLGDSGARLLFYEDDDQLEKVEKIRGELDALEHVISFAAFDELREKGDEIDDGEVDRRVEAVSDDDLFTLIYTSGTTGPPKGCCLTHTNYRANIDMVESIADFGEESTVFVFLPLAHALTRVTQMLAVDAGATIAYWDGEKDNLIQNLRDVRPTHFPAVPRIFEKIYAEAKSRAEGGLKEKLLDKAIDVGRRYRDAERSGDGAGPILKAEFELADKQIFSNVRDLFGGRVELALTGAAPVAPELLEFFYAAGVLVLEGYGATETSAVTAANRPDDFRFGTVGKALEGAEIRIDDDRDDEGRGEIHVKGPHVFQGYHGLEEETSESFTDDGWFKTGDLGTLDDDGWLTVSGRTKDIIITSSGKNITPTNIENMLADHKLISQAVVYGDDRPYLVALITLDPDEDGDEEQVQQAVDATNEKLAKIEQIKKFTILDRELSQDEDELTPTLKVKRQKVYDNHAERFDELYDD
jgi:long-chain acyl-CoA synthetase